MSASRGVRSVVVLVAVVLVAAVGAGSALSGGQVLVVESEAGEELLVASVSEGTTVALEYTHSVERNRVLDAYTVHDGELVMTRMEFESYGAGLPASAEVTVENGTFVFDPEGSYAELWVKPGRIAGHRLHVGDDSYDLVALSDARTVRLHVERRSALRTALARL